MMGKTIYPIVRHQVILILLTCFLMSNASEADQHPLLSVLVKVKLTINNQPAEIEAISVCRKNTWNGAPGSQATFEDIDNVPSAVARVMPDNSAALIQLPALCFVQPGSSDIQIFQKPVDYAFAGYYFPDATAIDRFESYISIKRGSTAPVHVTVNEIEVKPLENSVSVAPPSELESKLVERFQWFTGIAKVKKESKFLAAIVKIYPENDWLKSEAIRSALLPLKEITLFKSGTPADESSRQLMLAMTSLSSISQHMDTGVSGNGIPFGENTFFHREYPVVSKGEYCEINKAARGIRYFQKVESNWSCEMHYLGRTFQWADVRAIYDPTSRELIYLNPIILSVGTTQ